MANNRLFANFVLLKYLLDDSEVWQSAIVNLDKILVKYQDSIELSSIWFSKRLEDYTVKLITQILFLVIPALYCFF